MLQYINDRRFSVEFLERELYRLFELFVPHQTLEGVRLLVEPSSGDGKAALASFDSRTVTLYEDYHRAYPEDYKVTLLHEAGHFIFSRDHSEFEIYYDYLKVQQSHIEEQVIPLHYDDFLYCKAFPPVDYTFGCSGCKRRLIAHSPTPLWCAGCEKNMLLVGGL